MVAAGEMLVSERAPLQVVTHIGTQGVAGYLIPAFMMLCGTLLWFRPIDRSIHSLLAIFLAIGSWITSNLGGYFVGMMVGVVGGALAFAWTPDEEPASADWFRGETWIGLRSRGLDLIFRLKGQWHRSLKGQWHRSLKRQWHGYLKGQWHRYREAAADRQDPLIPLNSLLNSPRFLRTLAGGARSRPRAGRRPRSSRIQITSTRRPKIGNRSRIASIWRRRAPRA
jgi:Family of unknown function (DUF6114)